MATERTPEEFVDQALNEAVVEHVLAQAVEDYASWMYAENNGLDPQTCEKRVDKVWNGLRDNLDGERRLQAIIMLIKPSARARYDEISRGVSR